MGVFLVNGETYNEAATGMAKYYYSILCAFPLYLSGTLILPPLNKYLPVAARIAAFVILIIPEHLYTGEGKTVIFSGLLPNGGEFWDLIGWAYLASSLVTLFAKERFYVILAGWLFFCILSMIYKAGIIPHHCFIVIYSQCYPGRNPHRSDNGRSTDLNDIPLFCEP